MLRVKQVAATLAVMAVAMVGQAAAAGTHTRNTRHARKHPGAPKGTQTTPATQTPTPAGTNAAGAQPASKRAAKRHRFHLGLSSASAHAASDPSDTISDFKFTPGSLTIHVGDTVTWTNVGPTAHTATAHDHSFDTGFLTRGQSASHTFTHAGTFAYICTLHPYL